MDVAEHLSENEAQAGRDARRWLLGFALVVATLLAFHPAWTAGFIWDDDKYVTQNPMLTAPGRLGHGTQEPVDGVLLSARAAGVEAVR